MIFHSLLLVLRSQLQGKRRLFLSGQFDHGWPEPWAVVGLSGRSSGNVKSVYPGGGGHFGWYRKEQIHVFNFAILPVRVGFRTTLSTITL